MPATGPKESARPRPAFSRRLLLCLLWAPVAGAAEQNVNDLFTSLASALSEGNSQDFMKAFDPSMPGYAKLQAYITALLEQAEITTSIDILREEENAVELDWFLQIRSLDPAGPLERRRQVVKCRLERHGRKRRIISLEPVELFAPLRVTADTPFPTPRIQRA